VKDSQINQNKILSLAQGEFSAIFHFVLSVHQHLIRQSKQIRDGQRLKGPISEAIEKIL
jgi:hypothetical protein